MTPWPASGRRRDHAAVVEARRAELDAWLAVHPATVELQHQIAAALRSVAALVDESTAAIWLDPLHAHEISEQGVALGTRDELATWTYDRYGKPLKDALGKPVVVFGCPCPGYSFPTARASEAVA